MERFRNVIFDLDGTLADTEPLHQRAFHLVLDAAGVDHRFDREEYGRIFSGRAVYENAEYLRERFALASRAEDLAYAHDALFHVLISEPENVVPMPGVQELLGFLSAQNARMAVASGSHSVHIEKILRALNLLSAFPVKVSATGDIRPKPFPDIYLKALQQLDAKAEETMALEDSLSGVRSARGANVFVIAVKNEYTKHQDLSEADSVVNSLLEVRDYLDGSD